MDFGILPKTLEFVAALGLAFNISLTTPPEVSLTSPKEAYGLEIVRLNNEMELVTESPEKPELITVEKTAIYTVTKPTQKPAQQKENEQSSPLDKKLEIIKEVKANEATPTPTGSPAPVSEPTLNPSGATTDSNGERLFQMVNDHRAKLGLASFEKDSRLCEIAAKRAPEVKGELATGTLHNGFKNLNLPYWATENIAAYSTIEQNLKFWLEDYIHRVAIEGTHKFSCVACSGSSCSQIFSSFIKK